MKVAELKIYIKKWLRREGIYYTETRGPASKSNDVDFIICIHGLLIAVKVVLNTGQLTDNQKKEARKIQIAGGTHFTVNPNNVSDLFLNLIKIGKVMQVYREEKDAFRKRSQEKAASVGRQE
jgi:hypothetical protein